MARYTATVNEAIPLLIQLGAPSDAPVYITGFTAGGNNLTGSATRPTVTRPFTPGVAATAYPTGFGPGRPAHDVSATNRATPIISFTKIPSLPTVTWNLFNVPVRVTWRANRGGEFVLGAGDYGLLYAAAQDGHSWNGSLTWEER